MHLPFFQNHSNLLICVMVNKLNMSVHVQIIIIIIIIIKSLVGESNLSFL